MNLVAGVGRALQGLLAHTWISKYCSSETFSSAASFSLESLPFFLFVGAEGGKASTTNGQADVHLVQNVLNFNVFSLIFIKYIL